MTCSTDIYLFHIIDICPWTKYACHILHVCPTVLLIYGPKSLHTSVKSKNTATFIHHTLHNICQQQICPSNANKSHIPQLFNVDLWGKYANIYTTYKVASINDVATIASHRQQWHRMQDDATSWLHKLSRPHSQISQKGARWLIWMLICLCLLCDQLLKLCNAA